MPTIEALEENFLESFPDLGKFRVFGVDTKKGSLDSETVLVNLYRHSLITNAHSFVW